MIDCLPLLSMHDLSRNMRSKDTPMMADPLSTEQTAFLPNLLVKMNALLSLQANMQSSKMDTCLMLSVKPIVLTTLFSSKLT